MEDKNLEMEVVEKWSELSPKMRKMYILMCLEDEKMKTIIQNIPKFIEAKQGTPAWTVLNDMHQIYLEVVSNESNE